MHRRKTVKWWKTIFTWILEIGQVNYHIIYLLAQPVETKPMPLAAFKDALISGLISLSTPPEAQRPLAVDVPATKPGPKPHIDAHIRLSKSPHLIDYDGVQRQCEHCAITKKKQRTTFYCDNCPGNPHLCPKGVSKNVTHKKISDLSTNNI
ncbi:hypothetical protein RRG08_063918 [Elysia crispata]|uniref:PiggyBac transposable element-derived protein 4 C-terminal zinc-ribbon domain-containing protein n=1 Tax=Elysia crispata TaxID=231223 RepID=A0AAE1CXZ2_9GAST|nr:hypothetical protein RRG08_063918 [Elysia crispata]